MTSPERHDVPLASEDIWRSIEALDSHEYWQLSEPTWRHSGAVILPSDDESLWFGSTRTDRRGERHHLRDRTVPGAGRPPSLVRGGGVRHRYSGWGSTSSMSV